MPSTFSNLGLELQATGENANTWGDKTNVGLQRVDNAIAGYTTVQANSTTITLAFSTNSGSTTFTDENGRNKILKFTSGTAGAAITVTVPDIEKEYLVRNETGQNITFSAGGGTTMTLATGKNAHIYIDGASAVYNGLADIVTTSLDTGAITTTGITTTGDINFGDNDKAVFGTGNDLQIYHDGSNSYIRDNGTGGLNIQGSTSVVIEDTDGNNMIACNDGGAVNLYHGAGSNKLQTTSTGVNVTGTVVSDGLTVDGNASLTTSGANGLVINQRTDNTGNSANIFFSDSSGTVGIQSSSGAFRVNTGATVGSASGTERMRIDSSGQVGIGTSSPGSYLADKLVVATSTSDGGITIASTGTNLTHYLMFADGTTGLDRYRGAIGYNHNDNSLRLLSNGVARIFIDSNGHLLPATTNTYDLGSSSLVWRNIYTSDFHMSNEGLDKGNDIDGTKGSWTFQEGEENLYLINNKNGKKYKFNLTEVA